VLATKAELQLAFEHPYDLLIYVIVRLRMIFSLNLLLNDAVEKVSVKICGIGI
jgi:hypothetical protein